MSAYKKLLVTKVIEETSVCKTIQLQAVDDQPIHYEAGQFLTFIFPKRQREERRSYSISASPILNEPLSITVKKIPNGEFSRKLVDNIKPGDILQTIGASGFFTLPADTSAYQQIFFIAAGSGIVPIMSMLKTILYTKPNIQVTLIYSNSSEKTTIFYKALRDLGTTFPAQLKIEWLMSSHHKLERARLGKWLLEILLKEYSITSFDKTLFYTCGPFDYMRMVTIKLLAEGVPAANIRKENFTIFKTVIKAVPPDQLMHIVTIHSHDKTHRLPVQYPETILQAAKKNGIDIPFSCEAGRCGTCSATCISGKVWMSYNEVLLEEEIAKGRVLTCVGYPVDGDVEISLQDIL